MKYIEISSTATLHWQVYWVPVCLVISPHLHIVGWRHRNIDIFSPTPVTAPPARNVSIVINCRMERKIKFITLWGSVFLFVTVTGLTQVSHPPNILLVKSLGKMVQTVSPKYSEDLRIIFSQLLKWKFIPSKIFQKRCFSNNLSHKIFP